MLDLAALSGLYRLTRLSKRRKTRLAARFFSSRGFPAPNIWRSTRLMLNAPT